jgi:hypothetical protein
MTKVVAIGVRFFVAFLLVVMATACSDTGPKPSAQSLPDNPENRIVVAKKYMEIMPPKEMLHEVASRVAPTLVEKDRKVFLEVMESPAIEKEANSITLNGLVKFFTVDELNAMVAFYGSPTGKAAYKKFGSYMGDIMPQIQMAVKKAVVEAKQQETKGAEPPKAQPATPQQPAPNAPPQGKK